MAMCADFTQICCFRRAVSCSITIEKRTLIEVLVIGLLSGMIENNAVKKKPYGTPMGVSMNTMNKLNALNTLKSLWPRKTLTIGSNLAGRIDINYRL